MKKFVYLFIASAFLFACNNKSEKGKFTVTGNIKNLPDQKVYLEELFFSDKNPEVLDTAIIKNGKFTIAALSPQQGLYRLRLEKGNTPLIFINDQPDISLTADNSDLSFKTYSFNSRANSSLKNFIVTIDSVQTAATAQSDILQQLKSNKGNDSTINIAAKVLNDNVEKYDNYIIKYIDTTSNAVNALFALGYTQNMEPKKLEASVATLSKRFAGNDAVTDVIKRFTEMMAKANAPAPELNMPDTSGRPFALSSLRGKYVLVDFWASWCGPCRAENPNVVKAYNDYNDKNFTVLGVSLDKDKAAWVNAIKQDKLTWQQISDLKEWKSAAVDLYNFESIPYNVLLDPQGRIIATELRGPDLEKKLAEVLK